MLCSFCQYPRPEDLLESALFCGVSSSRPVRCPHTVSLRRKTPHPNLAESGRLWAKKGSTVLLDHFVACLEVWVSDRIIRMSQSSLRKALFASEMIFSLLFLLLCFLTVHLPLRIAQCSMNHGKLEEVKSLPEITQCLQWCLPEGILAGILGPIFLAWGFASVASVSGESFSSRLFRWLLIPLGFAFLAAIAPLAESHKCLCAYDYDDAWLDEVLFLAVCSAFVWLGWRYAKLKQISQ